MKKLRIADADIMSVAIQQEISRSEEARYDHRLHGLLLVCKGHTCTQVAEMFGEERRTVQRWVNRFESHGLEGLREGERTGRPGRIHEKQWEQLGRDLRTPPRRFGFTQTMWDGQLVREHLRRHYRIKLGVRQCQRLFGQMGFRLRKPRPMVGQADEVAQRAFKKTASNRSRSSG
jgi:transposase